MNLKQVAKDAGEEQADITDPRNTAKVTRGTTRGGHPAPIKLHKVAPQVQDQPGPQTWAHTFAPQSSFPAVFTTLNKQQQTHAQPRSCVESGCGLIPAPPRAQGGQSMEQAMSRNTCHGGAASPCKLWSMGKCLVSSKALLMTGPLSNVLMAST